MVGLFVVVVASWLAQFGLAAVLDGVLHALGKVSKTVARRTVIKRVSENDNHALFVLNVGNEKVRLNEGWLSSVRSKVQPDHPGEEIDRA